MYERMDVQQVYRCFTLEFGTFTLKWFSVSVQHVFSVDFQGATGHNLGIGLYIGAHPVLEKKKIKK